MGFEFVLNDRRQLADVSLSLFTILYLYSTGNHLCAGRFDSRSVEGGGVERSLCRH